MFKYIESVLSSLKEPFIIFLATISLFIGPVADLIIAAILFAMFDFLTAIMAAYKRGIPVTSQKMGDTFPKLILYSLSIILIHFVDTNIVNVVRINFLDSLLSIFLNKDSILALDHVKLTAAVAMLILLREMKSIDENWKLSFGWGFFDTIKSYIIKPILTIKNKLIKNGTEKN